MDLWTEYSTFLPYVIGILAGVGLVVWIARKAKVEQTPQAKAPKAESKHTPQKISSETPVAPEPEAEVELELTEDANWRARLSGGLTKTRGVFAGLGKLFEGEFTEELEEEIEETLLTSDLGMSVTQKVIENLRQAVKDKGLKGDQIHAELRAQLSAILAPCQGEWVPGEGTQVIMMVGVNGAGKTTTLGKLAAKHKAAGRSVMLAAGDTFRAAAVEQLKTWGERAQVPVVAQDTGADSASVIFDALSSARAKQTDILLADTAGRLQNKDHLMDELSKVVRVLKKQDEQAPHEVLLVLDAGTGQNALSQAELFTQAVGVTGLVLTKLDGTAKGGVAFAIADKMGLPIRYIGVGEGIANLQPFDADAFVAALFDDA